MRDKGMREVEAEGLSSPTRRSVGVWGRGTAGRLGESPAVVSITEETGWTATGEVEGIGGVGVW